MKRVRYSAHAFPDQAKIDKTPVVEPDQGNGQSRAMQTAGPPIKNVVVILKRRPFGSPLTYHITTAARRRPEQSHPTYIHSRTKIYAGTDNEVYM